MKPIKESVNFTQQSSYRDKKGRLVGISYKTSLSATIVGEETMKKKGKEELTKAIEESLLRGIEEARIEGKPTPVKEITEIVTSGIREYKGQSYIRLLAKIDPLLCFKYIGIDESEAGKPENEDKIDSLANAIFWELSSFLSNTATNTLIYLWKDDAIAEAEEKAKKAEEEIRKLKKKLSIPKHRASAHLIDQLLKRPKKKEKGKKLNLAPTLWDEIPAKVQNKIIKEGLSIDYINTKGEGIKLSPGELKLLFAFVHLLNKKSQVENKKKPDYLLGNFEPKEVDYSGSDESGKEIKLPMNLPGLRFTLYELVKAYTGKGSEMSGKEIEIVRDLLTGLAWDSKKFCLVRYRRVTREEKGRQYGTEITTFRPLIEMYQITEGEFKNGLIEGHKDIIVHLNPVFVDQIREKFIEFPEDLLPRLIDAAGTAVLSEVTSGLVLELTRAYSNRKHLSKDEKGRCFYEIGLKRTSSGEPGLLWTIGESYLSTRNQKALSAHYNKALQVAKDIGLLEEYQERENEIGEKIGRFILAKKWE